MISIIDMTENSMLCVLRGQTKTTDNVEFSSHCSFLYKLEILRQQHYCLSRWLEFYIMMSLADVSRWWMSSELIRGYLTAFGPNGSLRIH